MHEATNKTLAVNNVMEQFEKAEPSEFPIDIREYIYLFKSWGWLIMLAGLMAIIAAYIISLRTTPVYQASTRLLVSAPSSLGGIDASFMVTTQSMMSTYSQMLLDRPVLQGVIDQLQLQITPEALKRSITVDVVTNTQLMIITVKNTDPALAADLANGMASVFIDRIRQLQSERFAASRDGLSNQISDMEEQITNTNGEIAHTTDESKLQQLQARLTQYLTIYSNLVTSYEQVRLAEAQTSTNVVVSELANVPSIPVSPKTRVNMLVAGFIGVLLAVGVVFTRDILDDTVKNPDMILKKFNQPILGVIDSHKPLKEKPFVLAELHSPSAEGFWSLRTNLTFASVDTPLRRILVTSPMPQDGRTTVASNLALVLAQGEKKTLLMDADLRHPSIQIQFGLSNEIGLTELLAHPLKDFSNFIQGVDIPGLTVITSGVLPPNPSELLTSKMVGQTLKRLNQVYDLIVIDTPAVLSVADAIALAPAMDGVILVVKPGTTKIAAVQQALEQLRAVGACVLGVVLNDVNHNSPKYGYFFKRFYAKDPYRNQERGGGRREPGSWRRYVKLSRIIQFAQGWIKSSPPKDKNS